MTLFGMGNRVHVAVDGDASKLKSELKDATQDVKKFADKTERELDQTTKRTKRGFGDMGAVVKGAFSAVAVKAIADVITDLDRLGREAEGIRNRFEVVFGDMSDEMRSWADDVNERFGTSVEAVQDMANQVQDVLVPIGFAREAAADMTQEVLTLANALSEWSGGTIDVADAQERIRKALLGEREGLEALGVKILQSDVNARLAAEGHAELTGEAKAQAEAVATLQLITDKSTDAIAAYRDEANESLIAQKELTAAWEDGEQALADFIKTEGDYVRGRAGQTVGALQTISDILSLLEGDYEGAEDSSVSWTERIVEAIPVLNDMAESLDWATRTLEENRQRLLDARPAAEKYGDALGALPDHLTDVAQATGDAGDETDEAARKTKEYADKLREEARAADAAREAIEKRRDALREVHDPLFRVVSLSGKLADAEKEVEKAEKKGVGSDEYRQAVIDRAELIADLNDTMRELREDGIDPTGEAAARMLEGLDVPRSVIADIFATFDELQRDFESREWKIDLTLNRELDPGPITTPSGSTVQHTGGVVNAPRGQEVMGRLLGGEIVVNPDQLRGGTGGGITIHNTFHIEAGDSAGEEVAREIARQLDRWRNEVA